MSSAQEFRPKWVSPPGETIAHVLRDRRIPVPEFAEKMGISLRHVEDLLRGRSSITLGTARQLARVLGSSVEFWIARDYQYQQDSTRLRMGADDWLSALPVADMINFGWVKPAGQTREDKLGACLDFFDVPNVAAWHKLYAGVEHLADFRTSPTFRSQTGALAAWLRKGEMEAQAAQCAPWDSGAFQNSLPHVRQLTWEKNPDRFVQKLSDICAASGVVVVVMRAPRGCRASGATRFLSDTKALLMLSFRYLSNDQFWFTFFHEAGHLLLHGRSGLFIEGFSQHQTKQESEANDFAENCLIPGSFKVELHTMPLSTTHVIRFARKVGIAPGIVVGQLQHHRRIRHNQLSGLKRRFSWAE